MPGVNLNPTFNAPAAQANQPAQQDLGRHWSAQVQGANANNRYMGGTVSGAPTAGTFAVGDFVIDQTGAIWICTAAGAPGTWVSAVGGTQPTIPLQPTGTLASTFPRWDASSSTAALVSGTIYCCAIGLAAGITVTNISLFVAGTAESGGTHAWVGIADSGRVVKAVSADKTGATYFAPTQTAITTAVATPYITTYTGLYYLFVCVVGTTPIFASTPALENAALSAVAPIYCGTADTSQTTPPAVSATLATITGTAGHLFYAWIT